MKYTRYDLKKKNNNLILFIIIIIGILILAFVSGTIISDIFIKGAGDNKVKKNTQNEVQMKQINEKGDNKNLQQPSLSDISSFVAIQCGAFSNKDNAQALKIELSKFGKAFSVEEEEKIKVILGIYSEKECSNIINSLKNDKKEYSRVKFELEPKDPCDMQICEMIDANLQIIHKLYDNKVKSVQTKQIKEWVSNLKNVDKNSTNYKLFLSLKDNINKLPEEISKDEIDKQNIFIYNVLKEIK
ncbi:SPOR domain-containing protein [Clostridium ganghwense]|uniref:SPOR domain-containing protein n=1 Tax=Clostridium ganghwense TaxID=312089 RepID=A0ABT4CRZ3_9CLOT|nr:SPOR domain-containing protein [Clostridium ganghwense]MCY6370754.1 SPOR domain-containing protein [Clostridium ganghwense]